MIGRMTKAPIDLTFRTIAVVTVWMAVWAIKDRLLSKFRV